MATVEYSAVIATTAEHAWKVLRNFGEIAQWHPAINESSLEDGQSESTIGSVRRLDLADGGVLRERLLVLDNPQMRLTYKFEESPLPLDNYRADVRVIKVSGELQCVIEWRASSDVRDAEMTAHFEALITRLVVDGHDSLALYLAQSRTCKDGH
ncbi:SRPBCC family protein [Pseudomonas sp. CFBP 13602]|uniref:SRPBCC family protein n=1 Tax=Pseudomonas sp. CFBP 13602 TaxID=2774039 RepID=UPI0017845F01|nr:SRPBCC family protein [Pseudomonas sp. CFBP 13602]MBD8825725.1 SRPBCC family protein [Pseudomonas sp. CFBP 13602]